jgi:ferredoxin-thioredoxin reductase catalytic subunit
MGRASKSGMNFTFVACFLMVLFTTAIALMSGYGSTFCHPCERHQVVKAEKRLKVSPCELKKDPGLYNHKLVEVTGFVSHGFENFTLFDPTCPEWPDTWLEYGGTAASGTMYCCGVTAARSRPKSLVVENIPISLVEDERFQLFDKLLQRSPDSVVRATIAGRFFSGEKISYPARVSWGGYGHMGCCSLLAIEQIVSVEPHTSIELDYGYYSDQPDLEKLGCGNYRFLTELREFENILKAQVLADSAQADWFFTDPQRVATERLAKLLMVDPNSIELKQTRKLQGRVIYDWHPRGKRTRYMVVVSRPYWLSFYAKDPKNVAWVVLAAFESCG